MKAQPVAMSHLVGSHKRIRDHHIRSLETESQAHPVVNHVWLENVARGRYLDMESALRHFARDYYAYSSGFPTYLRILISKLEQPEHRAILQRNLSEEQGGLDSEDRDQLWAASIDPSEIDGVPHTELYRRFCRAMGLSDSELAYPGTAGHCWRQCMIDFLVQASPAAALGALGPGTENIVRPIYGKLLRGIRALRGMTPSDYVFFELHCTLDDQHAQDLQALAFDLVETPHARRDIRQGMLEALRLRQAFFSTQHERASQCLIQESA